MKCLRFAAVSVVVSACVATGDAVPHWAVAQDSAGITIVNNDLTRLTAECAVGAAPSVVIGSIDGGDEYELHRVFGATQLSDGRIAIVNQGTQQLRFYDKAGKYLRSSGRAGNGPGEFRSAFLMWPMPADTIWVGNYVPWEFHVFASDGRFVRTVRPSPQYYNNPDETFILDDGRQVIADGIEQMSRPTKDFLLRHTKVLLHRADGTRADSIGVFPNGRWGRVGNTPISGPWIYPYFESFARMAGGGSRFVVGPSSKAELRVYTVRNTARLTHLIRFTTSNRRITSADVNAERQRLRDQYKDVPPAQAEQLVAPLVSTERPVADEFPAFANLHMGRDGRLWMREYVKPGGKPPAKWIAFDANGRAVCRAAVPSYSNLWEFGADYVLITRTDSLGVEQVVKHRIDAAK